MDQFSQQEHCQFPLINFAICFPDLYSSAYITPLAFKLPQVSHYCTKTMYVVPYSRDKNYISALNLTTPFCHSHPSSFDEHPPPPIIFHHFVGYPPLPPKWMTSFINSP